MSNLPVKREEQVGMTVLTDPITQMQVDTFTNNMTPRDRAVYHAVCQRYGFDPIAKEVEILHGQIYITAKGINRIACADPNFDGIEIEVLKEDWESGFFVVKARAYRKDCSRPIEDIADSHGSKMKGGNLFRHTITRAKNRALRAAFALPFCSSEEMADDDRPQFYAEVTPPPRAAIAPTPQGGQHSPAPIVEAGQYAHDRARKFLFAAMNERGLSHRQVKAGLLFSFGQESTKELGVEQLEDMARTIKAGPSEQDQVWRTYCHEQFAVHGMENCFAEALATVDTPWKAMFLEGLKEEFGGE